ncbi:MAG: M23/M56 family metallopeptidase [Bacteroidota bacterium]
MSSFLIYLAQASLGLGLITLAYRYLIHPSAHYTLNRWTLWVMLLFALSLPLIEIPITLPTEADWPMMEVLGHAEQTGAAGIVEAATSSGTDQLAWSTWVWAFLTGVWGLGGLWRSTRLLVSLADLRRFYRASQLQAQDTWRLRYLPKTGVVFSFGRSVFVGPSFYELSEKEQGQVIQHEQAHLKAGHTWDVLFMELLGIIFWFHPTLPLLKQCWKETHELEADAAVLHTAPKHQYARLLLKVGSQTQNQALGLAFAYPPLNTRIRRILSPGKTTYLAHLLAGTLMLAIFVGFGFDYTWAHPELDQPVIITPDGSIFPDSPSQEDPNLPDGKPIESAEITSGFGMRTHPVHKKRQLHMGVDYKTPMNTPVYATGAGTVDKCGAVGAIDKGYGIKIDINHGKNGYMTRYAHLDRFIVKPGDVVKKGQLIGYTGNTGMSKKPHLHYEIRKDGRPINPTSLWQQ